MANFNKNIIDFGLDGYEIIQLPEQTTSQMMGYLILTPNKRLIVIDGGIEEAGNYLLNLVNELGEKDEQGFTIDAWIITHPHYDHLGAFTYLVKNGILPKVKALYYDFPDKEWIKQTDPHIFEPIESFFQNISRFSGAVIKPERGLVLEIDGLTLEFLTQLEDTLSYKTINDSSIVFKVFFPNKTALFLADLTASKGEELLKDYGEKLKSDIVQMAHHGQSGVLYGVYKAVSATIALWPTPKWLWENNDGSGFDKGPWTTMETRRWMDELGVEINAVTKDGEYHII